MSKAQTPDANSPQLVTRFVEAVSRGVRSARGLQETLALQAPAVRATAQAAEWLGFVETEPLLQLTPLGLEYVVAGRQRAGVYARAVWSVAMAADLLVASDGQLPEVDAVKIALTRADPSLSESALARRVAAVRGLLSPVVGRPRPRAKSQEERQLGLPLGHAASTVSTPRLDAVGDGEYDPDLYRYVLVCLLDFGELSLGHLRQLLDRAGAPSAPIGGCVDMAVSRGDAARFGERLVITADAVGRRALVATTPSVMLSDPLYRAYLDDVVRAESDRKAAVRRDAAAARFRRWDRRLFGHPIRPESIARDLETVLMDRPLSAYPIANGGRGAPVAVEEPFLDVWERRGLFIGLPPTLAQLQGGLASVNRLLERARRGTPGLPDLSDRPSLVHGGLLHPGEPLPRSVPDVRSLRLRVLMHAPYPALVAALLFLHRLAPGKIEVREDPSGWRVRLGRGDRGALLSVLDEVAAHRGWWACRRPEGGLSAPVLVAVLEALGVVTVVGRRLVLAERLFVQLDSEPEEMEVAERLRPLAEALEEVLEMHEPEEAP